jgi:hypothetical protein
MWMETVREHLVAECFWPDVDEADLALLEQRIEALLAELGPDAPVRYLGSILLREDEVVLCQFEGTAGEVRRFAERAQVPFARLLVTSVAAPPAKQRRDNA